MPARALLTLLCLAAADGYVLLRSAQPPRNAGRRCAAGLQASLSPPELTRVIRQAPTPRDLLGAHAKHGDRFNHIHLSAFWNTLGKLTHRQQQRAGGQAFKQPHVLDAARASTLRLLPSLGARELANVAHGMAKSGVAYTGEWRTVWALCAEVADQKLGSLKPGQEMGNLVWAFATARADFPELFGAIARRAAGSTRSFNPQELANTAWAFATARLATPALFRPIAATALPVLRDFTPQEMANLAWAYATADIPAPELFDGLAEEWQRPERRDRATGHRGQAQNIANTLWAFATASHASPDLFHAFGGEARGRLADFKSQELTNTVWAFATAGVAAPALFDAVAREAPRRVREYTSQDLANTAWAFATAGHAAPELFHVIRHRLQVRRYKPCVTSYELHATS